MAVTLTSGGGVVMNDGAAYGLISIDLGKSTRNETWLKPAILGAPPILAGYWDDVATVTISLWVKGSSAADLQNKINTVRNQFLTQSVNITKGGDNFITYGIGGATKSIVTFASPIDPVNLSNQGVGQSFLYIAAGQFLVPNWTFQVTRSPYFYEDLATHQTPAI